MIETKTSYDRSFLAKLLQTTQENKDYYVELLTLFKSYKKVNTRLSFSANTIYTGRKTLAKIVLRGKTLMLLLALDPKDYLDSKYFFDDVSSIKSCEKTPMKIKVKSARGLKYAKELIQSMLNLANLEMGVTPSLDLDLGEKTDEELIKLGLIKVRQSKNVIKQVEENSQESDELLLGSNRLFINQDKLNLMPTHLKTSVLRPRHKTTINLDIIDLSFEAYEVVSFETLVNKGLISENCDFVKVLGVGTISKPLLVIASSFSKKAIKQINDNGGKAVFLK